MPKTLTTTVVTIAATACFWCGHVAVDKHHPSTVRRTVDERGRPDGTVMISASPM